MPDRWPVVTAVLSSLSSLCLCASVVSSGARQNVYDVAVLDDVGLALDPLQALRPRLLLGADAAEVLEGDDPGPVEAARQVGVDLRRRLDRVGPARQRP